MLIVKMFSVRTKGLEFVVSAKDWYNAIQMAYEKYIDERNPIELISYMEFRDYCSVSIIE